MVFPSCAGLRTGCRDPTSEGMESFDGLQLPATVVVHPGGGGGGERPYEDDRLLYAFREISGRRLWRKMKDDVGASQRSPLGGR